MQTRNVLHPAVLSSVAQTASQRDVTLRFVYSAMHCHRHVDKDKYIKTRMSDVLFDRPDTRPLVWEVMVVHADGCECLQQHLRCLRPYQHNGNAHNLCMFWEPSTDVFVRPSKHNTRSHLLANVSLSCVCVFLWVASWPWFGSKLLARSAVLQEVLLSLRCPSGSLFFWSLTWCLLQGRRHRTVPPSPRHCGQAE